MNFEQIVKEHQEIVQRFLASSIGVVKSIAMTCETALRNDRRIYLCGNGGSAADCQHIAAEFTGRFETERRGLAAIALTTDTSALTSIGNDYGYDRVFARQVEALMRSGDVLVGFSTSGNSINVVEAFKAAKRLGAVCVGMTGEKQGRIGEYADLCLKVPSSVTARIQECHIMAGHMVCAYIDEVFASDPQ